MIYPLAFVSGDSESHLFVCHEDVGVDGEEEGEGEDVYGEDHDRKQHAEARSGQS